MSGAYWVSGRPRVHIAADKSASSAAGLGSYVVSIRGARAKVGPRSALDLLGTGRGNPASSGRVPLEAAMTDIQERRAEGAGRVRVETLVEVCGNEPGIPAFEAEAVDVSARG